MSKTLVIVSPEHPLYDQLIKVDTDVIDLSEQDCFDELDRPETFQTIFDFTVLSHGEKEEWLGNLVSAFDGDIISDTTTLWGDYLQEKFDLSGAMACAFYSPQSTVEVWAKDDKVYKAIESTLSQIKLKTKAVQSPGISFTYPRTISMIINEAFFSLEEELATREDIDTAMKFGVNYPLGPFEWCQKIGAEQIVNTLDNLLQVTGDSRYRVSQQLRLEILKN